MDNRWIERIKALREDVKALNKVAEESKFFQRRQLKKAIRAIEETILLYKQFL